MGSLSPRTRNAQVALYQSGEVDFLVATDAIGMGLNMDVDHVAFAGLRKFDGQRTRGLHPQEIGQIAGRAGRYRTTAPSASPATRRTIDATSSTAVEDHRFEPVEAAGVAQRASSTFAVARPAAALASARRRPRRA